MSLPDWMESHIDAILDAYADFRITKLNDPRDRAAIIGLFRPVAEHTVKVLRGQAEWREYIEELIIYTLPSKHSSPASISEATRVLYQTVLGILDAEKHPQRDAWALTFAEQMIAASEHVARSLDIHLKQRLSERDAALVEQERLQQEVIEAQQAAIRELSTPIIPLLDRIIVLPVVGSVDTRRARDILRALLAGIREHRARVVILDVTGVAIMDTSVASHLTKAIQAARLKGARTIVTGLSDAAAETIVEMGIDWGGIETLGDLQTGLSTALRFVGLEVRRVAGADIDAAREVE